MKLTPNPAEHYGLWDIVDDVIVTAHGGLFGVLELRGTDPSSSTADTWSNNAEALETGIRKLPDGTLLQFISDFGTVAKDEIEGAVLLNEGGQGPTVFDYQRRKRVAFLDQRGLRRCRHYVVFGPRTAMSFRQFGAVSKDSHLRSLNNTNELGDLIAAILKRAGIASRRLPTEQLEQLSLAGLHPGTGDQFSRKTPGSLRESLIADNTETTTEDFRIGQNRFKVLAAKWLPKSTYPRIWEDMDVPEFDFRVVTNIFFPLQVGVQSVFEQFRKFAFLWSARKSTRLRNQRADAAVGEFEALGQELVAGEKLVHFGIQVITWANTQSTARKRCNVLKRSFADLGIDLYEEQAAHDVEFFKSLPGMATTWDRFLMVPAAVASDFVPKAAHTNGDDNPMLLLENGLSSEPFGLTLRSPSRPNDNFLIVGGSGVGKSVLVNMLLAYGVLSGPNKGRVLALDYASPEKSSFKVAAEVFGGKYIPIKGDGAKINPFPEPRLAMKDGRLAPDVLSYLTSLTNLLLHNEGSDKVSARFAGIIQDCLELLYAQSTENEAPTYSDFSDVLTAYIPKDSSDEERKDMLRGLLDKFLRGPEAALLNCQTTADTEGEFLVYDLFGLHDFEPRIRTAVAQVVTRKVRDLAFDGRPDRHKYVFLDESPQLFSLGMGPFIKELFCTARAHSACIGTIAQDWGAFKEAGIGTTISVNSALKLLLSHQDAQELRDIISDDLGFNQQEKKLFASVEVRPRKFSEMLVRTTIQEGREEREITAKARLRLSAFDYQVVTSAPADRAEQLKLARAHPQATQLQILEFLALKQDQETT